MSKQNEKTIVTPVGQALSIAVVCTPGLEFVTRMEVEKFGISLPEKNLPGLLTFSAETEKLYLLNLHLRTTSRLLVRLGEFNAAAFSELRKKAARLPWKSYLCPGQPVSIRVTTHASALYHKKGIAERVAGAVSDALGAESKLISGGDEEADGAVQLIFVRLVRNMCEISIDSSGELLHRRGYRQQVAKAPLRETLAASMIMAAGWPGNQPLVDPFCGSGTIPIEAALIAAGIPPGHNRKFAFESWPVFERDRWLGILKDVVKKPGAALPEIAGCDRDAGVIKASRANAERAGVAECIKWSCQSISDIKLNPSGGWVVTNPPYGERVKGGPDLRNLYARMGSVWREQGKLWHIYLLTSSPKWSGQLGMPTEMCARFNNGGIPVSFLKVNQHAEKT